MKLFLDDVRFPDQIYHDKGWVACRNIEDVMKFLRVGGVTVVSLDGDMGLDKEGRDLPGGVELLDWMRHTKTWPSEQVLVHSDNPYKAAMMRSIIKMHFVPLLNPNDVISLGDNQ